VKRVVRRMVESAGYRVYHRDVPPFGIEHMLDIEVRPGLKHPIRTFFDIGANIGQTSSLLSSFREAHVFAFEPDPVTFSKLAQSLGRHPRLATYNVAISNASGTVPFFQYSSSTLNSLIPDAQYPMRKGVTAQEVTVKCTNLSEFCSVLMVFSDRCSDNRHGRLRFFCLTRRQAVVIR